MLNHEKKSPIAPTRSGALCGSFGRVSRKLS